MTPLVELDGVSKSFAGRSVLKDLSLRIEAGDWVAVRGPSGSGKTTLLNLIGGLTRADRGKVMVDGRDLAGLPDRSLSRFRNEQIAFVFQAFNLLDHLSALENVMLPYYFGSSRRTREVEVARAREALSKVGLEDRASEKSAQLSGGQRQRVAIARALFARPRLILADEPTGNLDSKTGGEIIALFARLVESEGTTLLVVTHEERVSGAARRVLQLEDGSVVS